MSKAMLVMDMPIDCADCILSLRMRGSKTLGKCLKNSKIFDDWARVQDWCPLREVPKKIDYASHFKEDSQSIDFSMGYTKGYNDCIDEILGEKRE